MNIRKKFFTCLVLHEIFPGPTSFWFDSWTLNEIAKLNGKGGGRGWWWALKAGPLKKKNLFEAIKKNPMTTKLEGEWEVRP